MATFRVKKDLEGAGIAVEVEQRNGSWVAKPGPMFPVPRAEALTLIGNMPGSAAPVLRQPSGTTITIGAGDLESA